MTNYLVWFLGGLVLWMMLTLALRRKSPTAGISRVNRGVDICGKWCVVSESDGEFFVEMEQPKMFGHGLSAQEAVDDLMETITYLANHYNSIDNNTLTADGLQFKNELIELLKVRP